MLPVIKNPLFKNPKLSPEKQEHGLINKGGTNYATETFLHVNYRGTPINRIDKEAYADDVASYWANKEKVLMTIVAICLLFLTAKLLLS